MHPCCLSAVYLLCADESSAVSHVKTSTLLIHEFLESSKLCSNIYVVYRLLTAWSFNDFPLGVDVGTAAQT